MKVLREPQIISGFLYDSPVDDLPALTHCGEALCCRGHHLKPHAHPAFEFLYLARGRATWRAGGDVTPQGMGDLFIAYPGEKHGTGPVPNPENHHLWVGLKLERLGPVAGRLAAELRQGRVRSLTGCPEVEPVLRGLVAQVVARSFNTLNLSCPVKIRYGLPECRWHRFAQVAPVPAVREHMLLIDFKLDADVALSRKTASQVGGKAVGFAGVRVIAAHPEFGRPGYQRCLPTAA